MQQLTLNESFSVKGKGLHSGLNITATFNPAPENTGYRICRVDLEDRPVIPAVAENVVDTQRGTVLGKGDVSSQLILQHHACLCYKVSCHEDKELIL